MQHLKNSHSAPFRKAGKPFFSAWSASALSLSVLKVSALLFSGSTAFAAVCPCGAPPSCGIQPAFCYERPARSLEVVCESDSATEFGTLTFQLNRRKQPIEVQFADTICPMQFEVEGDRRTFHRARVQHCENKPGGLRQISYYAARHTNYVRVEVQHDREPDRCENTRVCDPSPIGYDVYRCKS